MTLEQMEAEAERVLRDTIAARYPDAQFWTTLHSPLSKKLWLWYAGLWTVVINVIWLCVVAASVDGDTVNLPLSFALITSAAPFIGLLAARSQREKLELRVSFCHQTKRPILQYKHYSIEDVGLAVATKVKWSFCHWRDLHNIRPSLDLDQLLDLLDRSHQKVLDTERSIEVKKERERKALIAVHAKTIQRGKAVENEAIEVSKQLTARQELHQ